MTCGFATPPIHTTLKRVLDIGTWVCGNETTMHEQTVPFSIVAAHVYLRESMGEENGSHYPDTFPTHFEGQLVGTCIYKYAQELGDSGIPSILTKPCVALSDLNTGQE